MAGPAEPRLAGNAAPSVMDLMCIRPFESPQRRFLVSFGGEHAEVIVDGTAPMWRLYGEHATSACC